MPRDVFPNHLPVVHSKHRIYPRDELKREAPGIAEHDQLIARVSRGDIVDERRPGADEPVPAFDQIFDDEGQMQVERRHRRIIGNRGGRVIVDLNDYMARAIGQKMSE